jgi:hypothetical protein
MIVAFPPSARAGDRRMGVGVLGDSYSDEYEFYPPDRSTARNWVEILAETRQLDFGPRSVTPRPEPRLQGFAYNWARSDATTCDMIDTCQHTGLAAQVARGDVSLVVIFIGGNDFINALRSSDAPTALRAVTPRAIANLHTAVRMVLDASPDVKLVLATVPDIRDLPEFAQPLANGSLPQAWGQAARQALNHYNGAIRLLAATEPRIALADLDLHGRVANLISTEYVPVANHRLDRTMPSNQPDHVFLADRRHAGTVAQGLLARIVVDAANVRFHAGIAPLPEREILDYAARAPGTPASFAVAPLAAPTAGQ